jgi:DNA-binding NtrC family response regulator
LTTTLSIEGAETPSAAKEPHLFLVLQGTDVFAPSARYRLTDIHEVIIGRGDVFSAKVASVGDARQLVLKIPDRSMSSAHARITRGWGTWLVEDVRSKNGIYVNGDKIDRSEIEDDSVIEMGATFCYFRGGVAVHRNDPAYVEAKPGPLPGMSLVTLSPPLDDRLNDVRLTARSNAPILLYGETGSGKEMVARAVHDLSGRTGAFVPVNCGALPEHLVESELFGHRKGAFSGATGERAGLIRTAQKGTLFLDEIGDLSADAQVALLRALQEGEVKPVGSDERLFVDFRIIAASHKSLVELARGGRFRDDLFARLGMVLTLPPLRERREDFGIILQALLVRLGVSPGEVTIHPRLARSLLAYDWPRNIRELEKVLEFVLAVARSRGQSELVREHLPESQRAEMDAAAESREDRPGEVSTPRSPDEERAVLVQLLEKHRGNVAQVARDMSTSRAAVWRLTKRYGVDPESFRKRPDD